MIESFLSHFRWFRRLMGGRWELWYIDVCKANIWLQIDRREPDNRWQPCSVGPRLAREDYS